MKYMKDTQYRAEAKEQYSGNDIEIDDNAAVNIVASGAWVAAWVWVANPERG